MYNRDDFVNNEDVMFVMTRSNADAHDDNDDFDDADVDDDYLNTLLMMISLLSFCTLIKLNLEETIRYFCIRCPLWKIYQTEEKYKQILYV